jgi:hypothetical protein
MTMQRSMHRFSIYHCYARSRDAGRATQCSRVGSITKGVGVILIGTAGSLQGKVPHDLLRSQAQGRSSGLGCRRAQVRDNQAHIA